MPRPEPRISPRVEEFLFSAFLVVVLILGLIDILGRVPLSRVFTKFGTLTAIVALLTAALLLVIAILQLRDNRKNSTGKFREEKRIPFGLFLGLFFFLYPALLWAIEIIPSTLIMTFAVLGLFSGRFSVRELAGAATFTLLLFIVFFILLGTNMSAGVVLETGLADALPTLRLTLLSHFTSE